MSEIGKFYVVATPIGNLADMTYRAIETLKKVDIIFAEDTRVSSRLLDHYSISKKLISCHEHNEAERIDQIKSFLNQGKHIALISDAGTPLISDPGYVLVQALKLDNFEVIPIPGASACITALSASGLPANRFQFLGFLPAKSSGRVKALEEIKDYPGSTVIYESVHRLEYLIKDAIKVMGKDQLITLAKEITKRFEFIHTKNLEEIQQFLIQNPDKIKGEFVIIFKGEAEKIDPDVIEANIINILTPLLKILPLKQAVKATCEITNQRKNEVYEIALTLK
jgi:16S rRNA (cytidine1402-2'-O)-methyltransferase